MCNGTRCTRCGGTLIGPDIILGAGHCGNDFVGQIVTIGPIRREVIQQRIHPKYLNGNGMVHPTYDFSLYNIGSSPPINMTTGPIVNVNTNGKKPTTFQPLTIIGTGLTSSGGNLSTGLRDAIVYTQDATTCQAGFGNIFNSTIMLCTAAIPTISPPVPSACKGDSGGPAIIRNDNNDDTNTHVIVGVISFGSCGTWGSMTSFARVSAVTSWIESVACTEWGSSVNGLCQKTPVVRPTARPVTSPTRRPRTCKNLKFQFRTDFNPEENIITLKNSKRTLWDYRSLNPNTDYSWTRCIPNNSGCTILNVTDTKGNGLARNGYMIVRHGSKILMDGWDIKSGFSAALGIGC